MELVKRTDDYKIFQKRSQRYAVRGADGNWINGAEKVKILVKEKLLKVPLPKEQPKKEKEEAPAAEAPAEEAAEEEKKEEDKKEAKKKDKDS